MPESYGDTFPTVNVQQGHRHEGATTGLVYRYIGGDPADQTNWLVDGGRTTTDPDTSSWSDRQTGANWYNKAQKKMKFWDGENVRNKPPVDIEVDGGNNANIDGGEGDYFRFTMTDDVGVIMTGGYDGQKIVIEVTQDSAGGHTLSWSPNVRYSTDLPVESFIVSETASLKTYFGLIYNGANSKWDALAVTKGF